MAAASSRRVYAGSDSVEAETGHDSERAKLIGAWHLVRIETPGPDGKPLPIPQPKGMLIYTRDGHMSVQLMYPASAGIPSNEYVRDGYEASFGSYEVDEATHTITHHVRDRLPATCWSAKTCRASTHSPTMVASFFVRPIPTSTGRPPGSTNDRQPYRNF